MSVLAQYYTARDSAQRVASGGVAPSEAAGESASASVLGELTPLAIQALQNRRFMKRADQEAEQYQTKSEGRGAQLDEMIALNASPAQGGNG